MNVLFFKHILVLLVVPYLLLGVEAAEVYAQKVVPAETSRTIAGKVVKGNSINILLDAQTIEKAWTKYLKEFGKLEKKSGFMVISNAVSPRISSLPLTLFATSDPLSGGLSLWWGFLPAADSLPALSNDAHREASFILKEFGKSLYIDDINKDIEQAEKALQTTVKQYEKSATTGSSLEKSYNKNLGDSVTLVQKTLENTLQREQLRKEISSNKADQEAALAEIEKMKKARDLIKEKLSKVE